MFSYRIIPIDSSLQPTHLIAHDAAAVMGIVGRSACKAADVERDGVYAFSLQLGDHGVWRIFQREAGSSTRTKPALALAE